MIKNFEDEDEKKDIEKKFQELLYVIFNIDALFKIHVKEDDKQSVNDLNETSLKNIAKRLKAAYVRTKKVSRSESSEKNSKNNNNSQQKKSRHRGTKNVNSNDISPVYNNIISGNTRPAGYNELYQTIQNTNAYQNAHEALQQNLPIFSVPYIYSEFTDTEKKSISNDLKIIKEHINKSK